MTASDRTVLLQQTRELVRRYAADRQVLLDDTCQLLGLLVAEGEWSAGDVLDVAVAGGKEGWPTQLLAVCVQAARRRGMSWRAVGEAFGVSRQAAHQRFVLADGAVAPPEDPGERRLRHADRAVGDGARAAEQSLPQEVLDRLAALPPVPRRPTDVPRFDRLTAGTPPEEPRVRWQAPEPGQVAIEIYNLALRFLSLGQKAYAARLLRLVDDDEQVGPTARHLLGHLAGKKTGVRRGSEGGPR
jgi:hypothetical protein